MKTNVGTADRVIRLIIAAGLVGLILTDSVHGVLMWVCAAGAAAGVLTALVGRCGLYSVFGISTCKVTS